MGGRMPTEHPLNVEEVLELIIGITPLCYWKTRVIQLAWTPLPNLNG